MSSKTYPVNVPGVGDFVFKKRDLQAQVRIQAESSRMLGGPVDDPDLRRFANVVQTLVALAVTAPADWKPLEADPLEPEQTERLWLVHDAMRDAEERFRKGPEAAREGLGAPAQ